MPAVTSMEHQKLARAVKQLYASYQQSKDLISIGAYVKGADPQLDAAVTSDAKNPWFFTAGNERGGAL